MKGKIRYLFIVSIIFIIVYFINKQNIELNTKLLHDFATSFTSIVLEAIPFILLGSFVSAMIQIYVTEETITKLIPKGSILGYFEAALIGIIFPVCECAIIPITRRLIKKGLPVGLGITFMLSVPIINPVVIMSTYYAFYDKPGMILLRVAGGFVGSIIIGIVVSILQGEKNCILSNYEIDAEYCDCGCNVSYGRENKFKTIFEHTNREFLDITRYLIFGALISSAFQILDSYGGLKLITNNKILVILFMMLLGFVLSLCSEADAFVGKSFLMEYSFSGVAAFLILGPMLDIKNLIMLTGTFKKDFVIKLTIATITVVFIISCIFMLAGI